MQSPMRSPMTGQDSGYAEECYPFQLLGTCAAAWRLSSFGAPPGMLSGPAWGRTKRRAMRDAMAKELHEAALDYHRLPQPGKLDIRVTKPLAHKRARAVAYSPGRAAACESHAPDTAPDQNG